MSPLSLELGQVDDSHARRALEQISLRWDDGKDSGKTTVLPYFAAGALPAVAPDRSLCAFDPGVTGVSGPWLGMFDKATGLWMVVGGMDGFNSTTSSVPSNSGWRKTTNGPVVSVGYYGSYYLYGNFDTTVLTAGLCGFGMAAVDIAATAAPSSSALVTTTLANERIVFNIPEFRVNLTSGTKGFDSRVYTVAASTMSPQVSPRISVRGAYCIGVA